MNYLMKAALLKSLTAASYNITFSTQVGEDLKGLQAPFYLGGETPQQL